MRPQSFTTDNIFDSVLKMFIFLLPIAYFPGIGQYGLQQLIFNNMAIVMFAMTFFMEKKRSSSNYLLPTALLLSLMVSFIKAPTGLSIPVLNVLFAVILYKSIVENVSDVKSVCNFFLYCGIVNMFFWASQLAGHNLTYVINPALDWQAHLLSSPGLMSRNYHLAFFFAMCLPLAFQKNKILGAAFLIVIIIQHSFAAYLGAGVGLAIYLFERSRVTQKNIIICLSILPVILLVASRYKFSNLQLRWDIWLFLSKDIIVNPFLGYGMGAFERIFLGNTISLKRHLFVISSYNQYIKQIAENGLIPVAICVIVMFRMIMQWGRAAWRDKLAKALLCGWISLLVIMMFHEALQYTHISIPFIMMMALCEARINQIKSKEHQDGEEDKSSVYRQKISKNSVDKGRKQKVVSAR